jgi:purine-binding chemotaxis protein CheW
MTAERAPHYVDDLENARKRRGKLRNFFTVHASGNVFGLPVDAVQTIFRLQSITPVPLGPSVIAGLVNLRGKIVTAVSLHRRLGLDEMAPASQSPFAVAVECRGETFALVVDAVGDAMECGEDERIQGPKHVTPDRARVTESYYRIENGILPVLDIDALFDIRPARRTKQDVTKQEPLTPSDGGHPGAQP